MKERMKDIALACVWVYVLTFTLATAFVAVYKLYEWTGMPLCL